MHLFKYLGSKVSKTLSLKGIRKMNLFKYLGSKVSKTLSSLICCLGELSAEDSQGDSTASQEDEDEGEDGAENSDKLFPIFYKSSADSGTETGAEITKPRGKTTRDWFLNHSFNFLLSNAI